MGNLTSTWTSATKTMATGSAVGLGGLLLLRIRHKMRWTPCAERAVLLTGCDRGLGFSLALHCSQNLGLTVFAGVLDAASPGARQLCQLSPRVRVLSLDVTDPRSVDLAVTNVREALRSQPQLKLAALVNNAGVLVFGEFGWQTMEQVSLQLDVNLAGTMRVTRAFLPLLRDTQHGRVIVVTSHCAIVPLPGLSVYGATKAGLQAWAESLRAEQAKYGLRVVQLVPGSFTHLSGILANHEQHARAMLDGLDAEDRLFYGDYPKRFHGYLQQVAAMGKQASQEPKKLPDSALHEVFEDALLSRHPRHRYIHEPWRYAIYHSLIKLAPNCLKDWLVGKFTSLPEYRN